MESIIKQLEHMDHKEALKEITNAAKLLLQHADEEAHLDFVMALIGDSGADKIASMVNL